MAGRAAAPRSGGADAARTLRDRLRALTARRFAAPLAVLAIGLLSTFVVALQYDRIARERDAQRFQALVSQRVVSIEERMRVYVGLLRGGAAFFAGAETVDRDGFRAFVERMRIPEYYKGVQGVGFAAVLAPGAEEGVAAAMRAQGRADFRVWPEAAGEGAPRTAILHLEPEDARNLQAIGFDMASEATRREAMLRAVETGAAAATGRVTLIQETDADVQPGFLIYTPVFRGGAIPATPEERLATVEGWVYSPFRARDLFAELTRHQPRAEVGFVVYDGTAEDPDALLYASGAPEEDGGRLSLRLVERFAVAQRPWTIALHTTPAFEAASPRAFTPFIWAAGLGVTLLLTAASFGQARAVESAERAQEDLAALAATLEHRVERRTAQLERARSRLADLNANLERAVDARTAELSAANEEIQRFAYIVSHDLRAPLVNVMGFTSELDAVRGDVEAFLARVESEAPALVGPEARAAIEADLPEALGFIRASTQKMDRLINAILKLSREGRRVLSPEPVDMQALVEGIGRSLAHQLDAKDARIAVEGLPTLVSDRLALEQIFGNLVENAVKYLKPGRPGRIVVTAAEAGPLVRFAVRDNGRGVDPRDFERIFDLFRRAGAQDTPGEGIGLAHVRALVRRLGGSIEVASSLGEGSTFTVTLPKALARDAAGTDGETEEAA